MLYQDGGEIHIDATEIDFSSVLLYRLNLPAQMQYQEWEQR